MSIENEGLDIDGVTYTQEDILNFTRARRIAFVKNVEKATGDGEDLATLDPERQSNYLAALRDLEKLEVSLMKIKQEEKNNTAQNAVIAQLILSQAKKNNAEYTREHIASKQYAPDINTIPTKKLIPGETEIGDRIEKYAEYKSRTGTVSSQDPHTPSA